MLQFKQFEHQTDILFDEIETIEGETRLYKTPYGNFPSMTSMLSLFDDGGIDKWIKRVGQEEADRIVTEAINRGNSLHDLSEKYLRNELTREQLKGPGKILFNRVKRYLDEVQLVIALEVPLYSVQCKYAGRTDAIVMIDDQITILDHKNSRNKINLNQSYARKKLFAYQLQCTGYARALKEMTGLEATQGTLFVGNHSTSNADRFVFEFDQFFVDELDLLIDAYYSDNPKQKIQKSAYFQL